MLSLQTAPGTRRAAVTRVALTVIGGAPIGLINIAIAGANIFLVFLALVPFYLLWVLVVDIVAIARSFSGTVHFAERPRYRWIFCLGLAFFAVWAFFQLTPIGQRMIGVSAPL